MILICLSRVPCHQHEHRFLPLPKGARGLTEYFFDVVISLEAHVGLYFHVKQM